MQVEGTARGLADADVQAVAIAVFQGEKADSEGLLELDRLSGGLVKSVLDAEEMKGKESETVFLHLPGGQKIKAQRLLLVGVGEKADYQLGKVSQMAGTAARFLRARGVKSAALLPRADGDAADIASTAMEGAIIGLFEPDKYRTVDKEKREIERLVVIVENANEDTLKKAAERGRIIGEAVNYTRDLANEPGAYLTPTIMANRAIELAKDFGLSIDVLDELIILKYSPADTKAADGDGLLAFVGKGITFDSGGISLKPGENMELMKYDMTGGATVMGALKAIAQLKPAMPILGVVPCSENLPSGKATKPGDVVRAMTGKTIEIINTDAEGRLILADAIAYAKKLGATQVIDLATLTGAVSIALGDVNAAILGTDQGLIDEVITAGREVGEKFWQLPLDKEYSKQIKSDIADIKNVGGRKGGTITAAAFLKEFAEGLSWAHLDIAGTAWSDEAKPYRAKGPTGIAVRTLINIVNRAVRSGKRV